MLRIALCCLALAALLPGAVRAAGLDRQEFRKAIRLPMVEILSQVELPSLSAHPAVETPAQIREGIAALRQALDGTPADADRWARMAQYFHQLADLPARKDAYERAIPLFREQLKTPQKDAATHIALARALEATGKHEEAAQQLATATVEFSADPQAWSAQGAFQLRYSVRIVMPALADGEEPMILAQLAELTPEAAARLAAILKANPPTPAQIERAEAQLREMAKSYAQGVTVAPDQSDVYVARGLAGAWIGGMNSLLAALKAGKTTQVEDLQEAVIRKRQVAMLPGAFRDFKKAADLRPEDPDIQMKLGVFCLIAGLWMAQVKGEGLPADEQREFTPTKLMAGMREAATRLEPLVDRLKGAEGAARWEALAFLQLLGLKDRALAEKSMVRALQLEPSRSQALNFLLAIYVGTDRQSEAVHILEAALKQRDTVILRTVLAKLYDRLEQPEKAEAQARAACALEPNGSIGNLWLAALLLKNGTDKNLSEVKEALARAEKALPANPSAESKLGVEAVRAGYLALSGNVPEARQRLKRLTILHADEPSFQKMLDMLSAN